MATLIGRSVCRNAWPTHFTRDRQQFDIRDLALRHPSPGVPTPLEAPLDRDRRDQICDCGLTPLSFERDTVFVPRAVCLSGISLAYQLLVVRLIRFLLWCRDNLPAETEPATLKMQLGLAFQVLGEQSELPAFDSVDVAADPPDGSGKIPVRIVIVPSPTVLPSKRIIELGINW